MLKTGSFRQQKSWRPKTDFKSLLGSIQTCLFKKEVYFNNSVKSISFSSSKKNSPCIKLTRAVDKQSNIKRLFRVVIFRKSGICTGNSRRLAPPSGNCPPVKLGGRPLAGVGLGKRWHQGWQKPQTTGCQLIITPLFD